MIILETRDSHIWNFENKIIEIIDEAVNSSGRIDIALIAEGPCLRTCNLYTVLDKISELFKVDKKRFRIITGNIREHHDQYTVLIVDNIWLAICKQHSNDTEIKKLNLSTIGCFIGKTNWPRLSLLSWLHTYYAEKSLITCQHDIDVVDHQEALELTELAIEFPNEIDIAVNFLKICPLQYRNNFLNYQIQKQKMYLPDQVNSNPVKFSDVYGEIFAELVCETYYTGLTFLPTEKTFRPILQMTPFIIFGPEGFLSNLKKSGFKTFDNYWDESYDDLSRRDRVVAIRSVLERLFLLSSQELTEMYTDMQPILIHNKNRALAMTAKELQIVRQK